MSEVKACIFDLDGVIVDTAKYHYIAWKRLAKELNFDFSEQDNERLKGVSRMRSLEILLEIGGISLSSDKMNELAYKKNQWYVEFIEKMTPSEILPGVSDFIQSLKQNNIKIALGSASKNAQLILEKVNLYSVFDALVDGTKVKAAKPNPEIFLKGAQELGEKPENCVVFEDAEAGIEAANRAEMRSIGIGSPSILKMATKVLPNMQGLDYNAFVKMINE